MAGEVAPTVPQSAGQKRARTQDAGFYSEGITAQNPISNYFSIVDLGGKDRSFLRAPVRKSNCAAAEFPLRS